MGKLSRVMAEHHQIEKRKLDVRVTGIWEGETEDLKHHVAQSIVQEQKLVVNFSDSYIVGKQDWRRQTTGGHRHMRDGGS